jgi:hypothetical protein
MSTLLRRFLSFSSAVTAFRVFDLQGTGQAESYLSCVIRVVGEQALTELLDAYEQTMLRAGASAQARTRELETEVFGSEKLGPVARNIIKLWYVGTWYELPPEWTGTFGAREHDGTFTASAAAYPEGLLWRAIGANPPGARAPGYGAWAHPPAIPPIPGEETAAPRLGELSPVPAETGLPLAVPAQVSPGQRRPEDDPSKETVR